MELVLILLVLGVVTLVGHGIWVALAALARAIFSPPQDQFPSHQPTSAPDERCFGCSNRLTRWDVICPSCGLDPSGSLARKLRDLATAIRQICGLQDRNELDEATAERLVQLLKTRRRVLLGKPERAPVVAEVVDTVRVTPMPLASPAPKDEQEQILEAIPIEPESIPATSPPIPPPHPPSAALPALPESPQYRPLSSMLSGFMEERNILWGELVGGLLIVGCSVALVLTLWRSLEMLPYFPFLLFTALTVALFAAGEYTLHHWKLTATSRGLLVIAGLLVPLNLLVLADPSARGPEAINPLIDIAVRLAALALFVLLVRTAGRDLIGVALLPGPLDRRWLLALAVVGTAGSQLLTPLILDEAPPGGVPVNFLPLAGLTVSFHLIAGLAVLGGLTLYGSRPRTLNGDQAHALFTFLGLGTFAFLAAFGYLLTRLAHPALGVSELAVPLVLGGIPGLALGLLISRSLDEKEPAGLRVGGTSAALAGVALMFLGVGLAWPQPIPLLLALTLSGLVLTLSAVFARLAWVHAAGIPALLLAVLIAFHLILGHFTPAPELGASRELMLHLTSAESAGVLIGAAVLLSILAGWLRGRALEEHALPADVAGLAVGLVSLILANAHGLTAPWTAALVHAAAVVVALLAGRRWPGALLPHVAGAVLVGGTLWALDALCPGKLKWWALLLSGEALGLVVAQVCCARKGLATVALAWQRTSMLAGALGLLLVLTSGSFAVEPIHTATLLTLSLALLLESLHQKDTRWFIGFQVALTGAVLCGVTTLANRDGWATDIHLLHGYGIGLAFLSIGWGVGRRASSSRVGLRELWPGFWRGLEGVTITVVVLGQVFLAVVCTVPVVFAEWAPLGPAFGPLDLLEAQKAAGPTAWLVLGLTVTALLTILAKSARQEEERSTRQAAVFGLLLLLLMAGFLFAIQHADNLAGASALRWSLGVCFLVGCMAVWLRGPLDQLGRTVGLCGAPITPAVRVLLDCAAGIVVLLTAIQTIQGFSGAHLAGPLPESPFARMGSLMSSITPLVLLVIGLAGTSLRERAPGYALAAGLLTGISAVGGYALGVVQAGGVLDANQLVFIGFLGSTVFALAGLAWLAASQRIGAGPLLGIQAWLGLACTFVTTITLGPDLVLGPHHSLFPSLDGLEDIVTIPEPLGVSLATLATGGLALLLSAVGALWHGQRFALRRRIHVAGLGVVVIGLLAGALARPYDTREWRPSYEVVASVWSAAALAIALGGFLLPGASRRWPLLFPGRDVRRWLVALMGLLVLVALLGGNDSSIPPAASAGSALAGCVLAGAVAWWFRRGTFVFASGGLFTFSLFLSRLTWQPAEGVAQVLTVALGLALSATFWLLVELPWRWRGTSRFRWPGVSYPALASVLVLGLLVCIVSLALVGDALENWSLSLGGLGWLTAGAVGVLLVVHVCAGADRTGLPGLYVLALILAGMVVHTLRPTPIWLTGTAALALAVAVGVAGLVCLAWQRWFRSSGPDSAFRLPWPEVLEWHWQWLLPAQAAVAVLCLLLSFAAAVTPLDISGRLLGPAAVAVLLVAASILAQVAPQLWQERLHLTALGLVPTTLAALAWALPDPSGLAPWLERSAWLFVALAVSSVTGLEFKRTWSAGRRLALAVGGLAGIALLVALGQMIPQFNPIERRTPLSPTATGAIALAIVGLFVSALRLAVRTGHDPLQLNETRRMRYVYLAEMLLVLLFVHARLNVPELFVGVLGKYWTFVVLLIAFIGVGMGEWFERQGLRVLAVPLARTGVFLPLIPILAFWARPPAVLLTFANNHAPGLAPFLGYLDKLPWHFHSHALVWFFTSSVYMLLAVSRQSSNWVLVAALAANFGFWALLAHLQVDFFFHPQAWLIPLALIILLAEWLHRHQLSPAAGETLRYLGGCLIYAASTADLFLVGLGNSLWLPVLLATLCVAGVGLGILLRVRAFVFLGVGFLLVDILSMIWYAAVDRGNTWLWWASGIVLGAGILAVFAVFEKRRNDVLKIVDTLRRWA